MGKDKEVMDHREDIIMGDMRRGMDRRDSIWMIDGEAVVGLRRHCWLVWRVVVVWMLVCCFKLEERGDCVTGKAVGDMEGKGNTGRRCTYRMVPEAYGLLAGWTVTESLIWD